jgi:hypothetical protein
LYHQVLDRAAIGMATQDERTESRYQTYMGFSLSIGNHGVGGPRRQKRLSKHFRVPARDVATAGGQFPITARIDIQSGIEGLLKGNPETELFGPISPNSHEALSFAQLLGGAHFYVDIGPLQYDEIDIGEAVLTRCNENKDIGNVDRI